MKLEKLFLMTQWVLRSKVFRPVMLKRFTRDHGSLTKSPKRQLKTLWTAMRTLKKFRSDHWAHFLLIGQSKIWTRPFSTQHVYEHAERFWYRHEDGDVDYRNVLLYAISLLGLDLELRYDEVQKMKIENVSKTPGTIETGSLALTMQVKIKSSPILREYVLWEWPSNSKTRHSMLCCPFTAILSLLSVRGSWPGFLFWIVYRQKIICSEQDWSNAELVKF